LLAYINRVSDYFFVLARYLNHLNAIAEPEWEK
jgi:cob(I)alamin adenosyltransferase